MQEQLSPYNSENEKNTIKSWLHEVSVLDGKNCNKSQVSELRAKLVTSIDISQSNSIAILKKFDEKLWRKNGEIYAINSEELISLQDDISRLNINNIHDEKKSFDLKKEVFTFTLNQSTLLALYVATIIFTKILLKKYKYVDFFPFSLFTGYLLVVFLVLYIYDKKTKNYMMFFSGALLLILCGFYAYFLYVQDKVIYLGFWDTIQLGFIMILNFSLLGAYIFSSIYSLNIFADNKINTPRLVILILVIIVYGVLIGAGLQGISTVI
ncbi:hypothetical protein [Acinetobacter seifertii]|jgi:hypothetical protein|uniref:hypothetical protein n=1 Tax=Acinetobacter seifertii TaxID=1530123 RepID=UPI000839EB29|nr:hypothetical protein [Acinetobacter seifertii]OCZ59740.1 hypothetical protein A7P21_13010 [Acinetobacter seifertii]